MLKKKVTRPETVHLMFSLVFFHAELTKQVFTRYACIEDDRNTLTSSPLLQQCQMPSPKEHTSFTQRTHAKQTLLSLIAPSALLSFSYWKEEIQITCSNILGLPPAEWKIESSDICTGIPPSQLCENRWLWTKLAVSGKAGMNKETDSESSLLRLRCLGFFCFCN